MFPIYHDGYGVNMSFLTLFLDLYFLSDLTLGSGQESLYIGAMTIDDKESIQECHDHQIRSEMLEDSHLYQEADTHKAGSQGNVAGQHQNNEEDNHADQAHPPVKCGHNRSGSSNSFSSFEFQEEGIIMSKHSSETNDQLGQFRINTRHLGGNQQADDHHGDKSLKEIPQESYCRPAFPQNAEHIGGTGIPAAVIPDVNSICSSDKVARLDTPAKITDNEN